MLFGVRKEVARDFVSLYQEQKPGRGRPVQLTPEDEMLLALLFLKQGLVDLLLGAVFAVSERTACNVRHRLLDFLYRHLKPQLTWGTATTRFAQHQKIVNTIVTWVVDGSEQPVSSSRSVLLDGVFYSAKKKQHSISILMVVDMTGRILYLSPSYPGSNNDIVIARETSSEWLTELENEWGLADAGFRGLADDGWKVWTPPTKHNPLYNLHSSYRVIVEQRFAAIKKWRACGEKLRTPVRNRHDLLRLHNQIWTIVAVLLNDYQ